MIATERAIADALADGRMTDEDAEAVRTFAEFLEIAGPPGPGRTPLQNCLDAGRKDLIAFALACDEDEVDQRIAEMKARANDMADETHPNDMTRWADIACQRGHGVHHTRHHLVSFADPNAYTDCTPIPERFQRIAFMLELWDFAEVGGPSHPYCPQADLVSETIVRYGIWEPRETVAMLLAFEAVSAQNSPWRFIDIGAQLGWYSILAQHFDAEVLAVEADPEVAAVLARNLGGEAEVMVRRIGPRTRLLDADDTPTVIKIDVEGAEPEALRWCRRLFEVGSVRFAMIEVSPVFHDRYLELLRDLIVGFGFEMADMPAKSRPPHAVETLDDFTWWGPADWETVVEWLAAQHQANVLLRAPA